MPKIVKRRLASGEVKTYTYDYDAGASGSARTIGALITLYKTTPEYKRLKPNSKRVYNRALDIIRAEFERVAIASIRRRHVKGMRNAYSDTPAIANQILMVWSVLLNLAVEEEFIQGNPASRIERLEIGTFERWGEDAVTYGIKPGNLPEHLRRAVVVGLYTGQREGDCIRMSWSDYRDGLIRVVQEKTDEPVWIPCHAALRAELDEWKKTATATTILTRATGLPWGKTASFCTMFWRELHRVDDDGRQVHTPLDGLVFHGLRKEASARLAEAGCSEREIMAITGHQDPSMVSLYTRQAEQKRRAVAAVEKLENWRPAERFPGSQKTRS